MTSFHIITAGCSQNFADSEQMSGLLEEAEFKLVDNAEEADIIIFNTCTVKTPAENDFFKTLNNFKQQYPNKIFVIAGCIAQCDSQKLKKYPLLGTKQIHKIVEAVEEALHDNVVHFLEMNEMPPLNAPHIRMNPLIEIVPISRGCLGHCSFCKTKSAKGTLQSYPLEEIVARAEKAVSGGAKEIWLTSQDTGCYGLDISTDLPTLLDEIIKISGSFKIRLGMMNPDNVPAILDRLLQIYQNEKMFKFLHLPVQSGSNEILGKMLRKYSVTDFKKQVDAFRKAVPNLNLMTDVIVGFPGETEEQYWETLGIIHDVTPDSVNISRFWPRPGTPAARMKQLPGDVVKHRSKVITDIFINISKLQNEKWLGWEGYIIIDEKGKEENQWIGRNRSYKPVVVSGIFKLGDIVKVKIAKRGVFELQGEVVN
ncbi:MAG: tRNA (N(6)-L-threonylcarbamoyladenosine(37)-C(2))-methylthiotransferase [Nanoarchaeota archaeon]